MDKENATVDLAQIGDHEFPLEKSKTRKTRSKSLGPGGLDTALKDDAGNRRKSIAVRVPKSILKSAIPLSPLKEIPSRRSTNANANDSPVRTPTRSPRANARNGQDSGHQGLPVTPTKSPSAQRALSPGKPPPSPRAHDRSHEESEKRRKERIERRRTLAARRVSFAPEATLHTWDVVEYVQDSTTSSASTNSTRRASAFAGSPHPNRRNSSSPNGPPSTPPEQMEGTIVAESPAHQRDLHQKKRRRRSSTVPASIPNDSEDIVSSSPYSGSSAAGDDTITSVNNESESGSDTDEDEHEIDGDEAGENTSTSVISNASGSSESARLDAALRQAVIQANTTSLGYDEGGDASMEMVAEEITEAFKPWVRRDGVHTSQSHATRSSYNQENIDPFSHSALKSDSVELLGQDLEENDEMSMEMTKAVGKILQGTQNNVKIGRKSMGRRQSVRVRRRSSAEQSEMEDESMDFTTALGGIQSSANNYGDTANTDQNEDLSMEFTSVFGGIKPNRGLRSHATSEIHTNENALADLQTSQDRKHASFGSSDDNDMEMTMALGGIINSNDVEAEQATQMDMTIAEGRILPPKQGSAESGSRERKPVPTPSPIRSTFASRARASVSASETGSPAPSSNSRKLSQKFESDSASTPVKKPTTPSKQITPKPIRPITPDKGTPSKNVTMRSASPKRLFQDEIKAAKSPKTAPSPFNRGNPGVVLAPPTLTKKRNSILFSSAENTGSPKAAALLDRRASIGDIAAPFTFQNISLGVRFGDPQIMEAEVMRERQEENRRESGRFILEQEADPLAEDATTNLKDLIGSMTPKKGKPRARKSLAIGGGKGLLGKRPRELDEPEDEDVSPERIRSRESPVKKIRLPAPPTKSQTIGSSRPFTPSSHSPTKPVNATTPKEQGRFKDVEALPSAQKPLPTMGQNTQQELHVEDVDEPIHLQDFLNMTSIRFMELNTTKRRHTVAPAPAASKEAEHQDPEAQLETAVVAASCTLPMLGLYQHSCRELKNYISAGRDIVREIEDYTFEENPPVFRAYLSASPATRVSMENQFKNIKSHARLLSKEMWYEWRMKLIEGINEDLLSVAEGLQGDDVTLQKQEDILNRILPGLVEEHSTLGREKDELQNRANELADCDQDELKAARQQLADLNAEVEAKKQLLQLHASDIRAKEDAIEDVCDAKKECSEAIKEAKKLREECRGWSVIEVEDIKAQVEDLVESTGWRIVSATPSTLTMVYRDDIELLFNPMAWSSIKLEGVQDARIRLSYVADTNSAGSHRGKGAKDKPLTTEKRFFLQLMQAHLHGLPQDVEVIDILQFISSSWDTALDVAGEISLLDRENVSFASIISDECLVIQSTLVVRNAETKVHLKFSVRPVVEQNELRIAISPSAEVMYGENYKEDRMRDFLHSKIGSELSAPLGTWADAVRDLKSRLVTRGRKP